jgi:membrane fusion protein (multidrug efflux system)
MKYIRFIFILFVIPGLYSCRHKEVKLKDKQSVTVDAIVAQKVNFPSTIEVNGTSLSDEMIELHPEISGRLIYLNIPDGATVSKGTLLSRVNDADLQAQLEQQKVELALATKTEQRLRQLLAINGVNQSDYDAALSQVNTINANIKVLEAQIDKTIIRAPFSGKLGLRLVSPGAYVTPLTLLGTLQQTDRIKIDFTVPEFYGDMVKVGNKVLVETNESDKKQVAVISAIEPQINVDTRNIKVRARLEKGTIEPGKFVKVLLIKNDQVIVVPSNSLIPDASSNQVIIIKKRRAVFTNVETGVRNADGVELKSGASPGDTIVVSGVLFVRPNAFVNVRSVKTQAMVSAADSNLVEK